MPVWLRSRLRYPVIVLPQVKKVTQKILTVSGRPDDVVSLDFIGDLRMRRLNQQYRGVDCTTDVLAFAMQESGSPSSPLLGDVVISFHTAARQAAQNRIPLDQEIIKLIIHGILHLLGYDHELSELEARRMHQKEQAIFRSLMPIPQLVRRKTSK